MEALLHQYEDRLNFGAQPEILDLLKVDVDKLTAPYSSSSTPMLRPSQQHRECDFI